MRNTSFPGLLFAALASLALSGCSSTQTGLMTTQNVQPPVAGAALQGKVHGGQNPIVGASVYLYAANTTGNAGPGISGTTSNASISLLTSGTQDTNGHYYVTTDSTGSFSVTGDYTCPSANSQIYLYAVGGNSGAGVNSAATLLAGLGACSAVVAAPPYVVVNEVSTIATAYAIAGFASNSTHVSSSGSTLALQGIANAFLAIPNLENLNTGAALATTPSGIGTAPQKTLDTLANALAACINSTGSASSPCTTLLDDEGAAPETASAAIRLAQTPGNSISSIYGLQVAGAPFQPSLTAIPNDFTLSVSYATSSLYRPNWIAVDKSGNIWISNGATSSALNNGSLMELSPSGQLLSPAGGYNSGLNDPYRVAIDDSGNIWVLNDNSGAFNLVEFSTAGSSLKNFNSSVLQNQPEDFAFDALGNIWVPNFEGAGSGGNQGSVMELDASTGAATLSGITGGGIDGPIGLSIDIAGHIWVGNFYDGITEMSTSGSVLTTSTIGIEGPGGGDEDEFTAVGLAGDVWAVGYEDGSVTELTSSGSIVGSGDYGGSNFYPNYVATDGGGNVWVSNSGQNSVPEWSPSGSPIGNTGGANGYTGPYMSDPNGLAIDGSGNVWVANLGSTSSAGTVTEFIGAAVPIVTPVVANLLTPYGTADVNRP